MRSNSTCHHVFFGVCPILTMDRANLIIAKPKHNWPDQINPSQPKEDKIKPNQTSPHQIKGFEMSKSAVQLLYGPVLVVSMFILYINLLFRVGMQMNFKGHIWTKTLRTNMADIWVWVSLRDLNSQIMTFWFQVVPKVGFCFTCYQAQFTSQWCWRNSKTSCILW